MSRPMFSTLMNFFCIILSGYYPSGCKKSNMADRHNEVNSKIFIIRQKTEDLSLHYMSKSNATVSVPQVMLKHIQVYVKKT